MRHVGNDSGPFSASRAPFRGPDGAPGAAAAPARIHFPGRPSRSAGGTGAAAAGSGRGGAGLIQPER